MHPERPPPAFSRGTSSDAAPASYPLRLVAITVNGTTGALPKEAWRSYRTVGEARLAAREMLRNRRVVQVAIVEDRPPLQFIEWAGE